MQTNFLYQRALILAVLLLLGCGKNDATNQSTTETKEKVVAVDPSIGSKKSKQSKSSQEKSSEKTDKPKKRTARPPERNSKTLMEVINAKSKQVQDCYRKVKLQEPTLTGSVRALITVSADGSVERVRFRKQEWNGSTLGSQVEQCATGVLNSLRFASVSEDVGSVTTATSYVFK